MTRIKSFLLLPGLFSAAVLLAATTAQADQHCAGALGRMPAGEPLVAELEILSWNIQKAGNPGWQQDLARLAGDAQLVFLQEASLQAGIPDVLPGALVDVFARGYATDGLDSGVMTLGQGTPALDCAFTAMEPWLGTPKAASVAEYVIEGREERLLTINLHAINFTLGVSNYAEQLAELAALLALHQGPAIVAGDLNTWSEARQRVVDEQLSALGLAPVRFDPDLRSRPFGRALDHVYVRGLRAESAEVIPVETSDHNPLRVKLALE